MTDFGILTLSTLISRKIWVTWKFCNFHTVSSRCLSSRNTVTLPSYCGSFESEENEAEAGEVEAPEAEDEEDEANKGYNEILNVLERLENETEGEVHNKDTSESRLLNLNSLDLELMKFGSISCKFTKIKILAHHPAWKLQVLTHFEFKEN